MEIYLFIAPYFCAVYDLPAGIFHGIKAMARKQRCIHISTHTHIQAHTRARVHT